MIENARRAKALTFKFLKNLSLALHIRLKIEKLAKFVVTGKQALALSFFKRLVPNIARYPQ
jgi:hypothetical protein